MDTKTTQKDPNRDSEGYYVLIPKGGKFPWEKDKKK